MGTLIPASLVPVRHQPAGTQPGIGLPGDRLHPLKGDQQGPWSIWVTGAWQLTFRWKSGDVLELDLEQHH